MTADYRLQLFAANRPERVKAVLAAIDQALTGRLGKPYEIEVVDVMADPGRAAVERVIMTPTLVIKSPAPERRLIGDLADVDKLCVVLGAQRGAGA